MNGPGSLRLERAEIQAAEPNTVGGCKKLSRSTAEEKGERGRRPAASRETKGLGFRQLPSHLASSSMTLAEAIELAAWALFALSYPKGASQRLPKLLDLNGPGEIIFTTLANHVISKLITWLSMPVTSGMHFQNSNAPDIVGNI